MAKGRVALLLDPIEISTTEAPVAALDQRGDREAVDREAAAVLEAVEAATAERLEDPQWISMRNRKKTPAANEKKNQTKRKSTAAKKTPGTKEKSEENATENATTVGSVVFILGQKMPRTSYLEHSVALVNSNGSALPKRFEFLFRNYFDGRYVHRAILKRSSLIFVCVIGSKK